MIAALYLAALAVFATALALSIASTVITVRQYGPAVLMLFAEARHAARP